MSVIQAIADGIEQPKTEAQLQGACVLKFNNEYKKYRGCLCMFKNETNKGAYYKTLGLIDGASDLILFNPEFGGVLFLELKLTDSRHEVEHVRDQYNFIKSKEFAHSGLFIFSVKEFFDAVSLFFSGSSIELFSMCQKSMKNIDKQLKAAECKGRKTLTLKQLCTKKNN